MFLLISDANVLIDIECGNLSSAMFSLPWKFAVPDILFSEELAERHGHLPQFGLIIKSLSSQLIAVAYQLRQQNSRTSINDLLALVLAKHENCQLLTGDKALRKVASSFGVKIHGTIWIVDQMIRHEKITCEIARVSFQRMLDCGSRLPLKEIEIILNNENIYA